MEGTTSLTASGRLASATHGQVVTVTTLDDISDSGGGRGAGEIAGSDGRVSFRKALIASSRTSRRQTTAFAIPQDECCIAPNMGVLKADADAATNITGNGVVSSDDFFAYLDLFAAGR